MALFLLLIWLVPALAQPSGTAWDSKIPVTWDGLVAHLLVIHNLNTDWVFQINGPAWSIATEWQLYFALPLLLLPTWRRFGRVAMLAVAVAVGFGVPFAFPSTMAGGVWYLALFALGALAAEVCVKKRRLPMLEASTALAWILAVALAVVAEWRFGQPGAGLFLIAASCAVGLAVALLVAALVRAERGPLTAMRMILESRTLVWLGLWSYSLYLIHSPLLALSNILLLDAALGAMAIFAIQLLIGVPLAAVASYVFHRIVERRFLSGHQAQLRRGASDSREEATRERSVEPLETGPRA